MKNSSIRLALIVGLGLFLAPTNYLHAATFTVTTTNISGPGSLPVVFNQANASGNNAIQFAVSNTLTLAFPLAIVTNNLSIIGRTDIPTVISGGGTLPLFSFAVGTTNSISNLVLANGYTTNGGAAINNAGRLLVSGCVITNNLVPGGFGGAVSNTGTMTIANTTLQNNSATNGGAIFSVGNMTISHCLLLQNQAGNGGAIYNMGTLGLDSLNIFSNTATLGFGGAAYNAGTLAVNSSTFAFNQATGGSGGNGHYVGGGGGAGLGGALFITNGVVSLTNTTIANNFAVGGAGGNALTNSGANDNNAKGGGNNPGTFVKINGSQNGGFGGGGGGGGAWTVAGGNGGFGGGGGGINGSNQVSGYNAGFGGGNGGTCNFTGCGGGGGGGIGSGIFVKGGTLQLVNCTVSSNSSTGGIGGQFSQGYSGDSGRSIGAGVFNYGGSVYLLNCIVAGNAATNGSPDLYGTFGSSGFNLIGNNQGATNLNINDFQNVAASLGSLQNNGGSTLTCLPLPGSFAIGYGTSTGAPKTDQRGVPRPQGGAFDIGAVQVVTVSPFVAGGAMVSGSGFNLNTIFDATNSYRIQASTNLTTWVSLITNSSGGILNYTDTAATNLSRRFYRAVKP